MDEIENPKLTITTEDITQANQLSLACPICANPVEKYVTEAALMPVVCEDCGTLYHKVCWEQGGGQCAMIGCDCKRCRPYNQSNEPTLIIGHNEIGRGRTKASPENKRLKEQEKRLRDDVRGRSFIRMMFDWLLRRIRILDDGNNRGNNH